jgi:sterol desaturase/sphingolipid hydroxylase (fatty acid hydroxylase superfamily)
MGKVLGGFVVFALLAGLMWVLERRFPAVRGRRREAGSARTDLAYVLIGPVVRPVVNAAMVVTIMLFALGHGWHGVRAGSLQAWLADRTAAFHGLPRVAQILVAVVLLDFTGYWLHRLSHREPLWRLHAVHHSSTRLDWLATFRNHPAAELVSRVLGVLPLLLLGVDGRVIAGVVPVLALWGVVIHANVSWGLGPLRYVIAAPLFHRWHHSVEPAARDKNFAGLLPVWDLLFGTYYCPRHQPAEFGADTPVPSGFFAQLAYPFRRATMRRQ